MICNLSGVMPEIMGHLERFYQEGGTLVCYGHEEAAPMAFDQVIFDGADSFYQAARHLFEPGHQSLGLFDVGPRTLGGMALEGVVRAAKEFNVEIRPEWLFENNGELRYEEEGVLLAQQYLSLKERLTAMCISNDYAAVGFMSEICKAGLRVPDDVSIVGRDDDAIACCGIVPLTSVNYALDVMAQHVIHFC